MEQDQKKQLNHSITRFLARREHSQFELQQKLQQRGFDTDAIAVQLGLFIQQNIQSDERFAHSVVRSAYINGKGPNHIVQKLQQHQIDEQLYQDYMYSEEFDWFERARQVREKRFGGAEKLDFVAKQKQMRFLQGRGFELDQIKAALV